MTLTSCLTWMVSKVTNVSDVGKFRIAQFTSSGVGEFHGLDDPVIGQRFILKGSITVISNIISCKEIYKLKAHSRGLDVPR